MLNPPTQTMASTRHSRSIPRLTFICSTIPTEILTHHKRHHQHVMLSQFLGR
jgi:hypothetical protein